MSKIFHPLLALIASAGENELAKYIEYLKHENKILRARLPKQVHTTLTYLCLQTREAIVTESTEHPDSAWVCRQTEWFAAQSNDREKQPELIIHDRDVKFTKEFTATVKAAGMKTNPLTKGSPNLIGRCERFIGTIKWECLSRFIVFGKRHLDVTVHKRNTFSPRFEVVRHIFRPLRFTKHKRFLAEK